MHSEGQELTGEEEGVGHGLRERVEGQNDDKRTCEGGGSGRMVSKGL